jgi:hypothetical protein
MRPSGFLIFPLLFFLLLSSGTTAFSFGAIGLCLKGGFVHALGSSKDKATTEAARSAAIAAISPPGTAYRQCDIPDRFIDFSDTCLAVVSRANSPETRPIEEKHFWIRAGTTEQNAMAAAFAACNSSQAYCTLAEVACDGTSVRPEAPSQASRESVSQTPVPPDVQSSSSSPEALKNPAALETSVEPSDPLFSLATINRFVELVSLDIRQFMNQFDHHWIGLVASTAAVGLFVAMQLYSIIRTGRRRLSDTAYSAAVSGMVVALLTGGSLIGSYAMEKLVAFGSTLSQTGRLLLVTVIAGIALLSIPDHVWRAIGKVFSGPYAPVPNGKKEVTEVEVVPSTSLPAIIPQPDEVLEPMPPLEGIVLKLKRSQKTGAMGGIIYMLDARIDASQETLNLISRHSLGGRLIYESEARQKHTANAQGHLANTKGGPSLLAPASEQAMGAAKTIFKLGLAAVSAVRASLALRITVNSLLSGVHVECKDMEELLEAEAAIREAKENLEGFIETAKTFDGREEIS